MITNKNTRETQLLSKKNYINNRVFYEELKAYKHRCAEAEALGEDQPPIPSYIASAIMMLAERLASKHSWRGYSYRDEMIFDAIENCIMYVVPSFNPEKSDNPFGYFSLAIKRAFIRRLKKEQKQQQIRDKLLVKLDIDQDLSYSAGGWSIRKNADDSSERIISARERIGGVDSTREKEKKKQKSDSKTTIFRPRKNPVEWEPGEQSRLIEEFMHGKRS
jgi:hypothetical protein